MPTTCSVKGCGSSSELGKSFFFLPAVLRLKSSLERIELSRKRRKLWLEALGEPENASGVNIRVCSDHFLTGRPAPLEDYNNVDWVPSLHMKLPQLLSGKKRKRPNEELNRKTSLNMIVSPKENTRIYGQRRSDRKPLNCKVLLDGNLRCTSFNGTNGSGLAIIQKHGKFTSDNITLKETAINNTVLRVRVIREDLYSLRRKYNFMRQSQKAVSTFGRQLKRKSVTFDEPSFSQVTDDYHIPMLTSVNVKQSPRNDRAMYNASRSVKGDKFQGKQMPSKNYLDNVKTLNRVIKRNDKDKIRVKFFPKTSTPLRRSVKNGNISQVGSSSPSLHREILFVNQFKNPLIWNRDSPDVTYYLKFPVTRRQGDGLLNYPFQKLVMDVKFMKLPGPSWKIKVIIRQGKIAAITFTNKKKPERCISFSANTNIYSVVIDDKPVLLLGSPQQLRCSEDLEVLMDIVEHIDPQNPMILYK